MVQVGGFGVGKPTMVKPAWHLSGKPYDVQIEALKRSRDHDRYGFFLEQGLGKTALILNEYIDRYIDHDTVFVFCPNSFKLDWKLAGPQWGVEGFTYSVWPKDELRAGTIGIPHFNIINFESVRAGAYSKIKAIMDKRSCVLIIDESSAIKNFQSQTAKSVLDLAKRAKVVRLLNGTPMVQNVLDLFAQLKCVGELEGMNPYVFKYKFAILGGYMGKQVIGVKNEDELHAIQEKCSFRALKKDWSDLPEKMYVPLNLEMSKKQRVHYKEMLQEFLTLVNDHEFDAPMVLNQMDKLRQIASGILLDGDKHEILDPVDKNPKVQAVLDLLNNGPGKMIVVHFYKVTGKFLYESLSDKGLNPSFIAGQMKPEDVIREKDKFNNDPSSRVMVAQISAASKGHTLLGGEGDNRCNRMVFFDQTFSLLDRAQMEDRIHRGAQDKTCLYYDPILSPIDQAQLTAITKKKDLAALIVDAVRATRGRI